MSASASGGLAGVGIGSGWLRRVVAADTDLVFGVVCEEWGLLIAVIAVICICALAAFTIKSAANGRSSFYVIAACAAVSMMVFQTILNTLGSVDVLPLTGVTFPFVSNGGSSMLSSWGLLAFVKAADTRRNASFAAARESFKVRIQSGEGLTDSSGQPLPEVKNMIGRSEYDFSKLGQIAERIRIKLIDKGIIKPEENVDYAEPVPENTEGMVELDDRKFAADDVIYSDPTKNPEYQAKINAAMQAPSIPRQETTPDPSAFERVGENSSVKRRRRHSYTDDDSGSEDYIGSRRRH